MTARTVRANAAGWASRGVPGLLIALLCLLAGPLAQARAAIRPAIDVAGPSPTILQVGNVAIAPDGTGGVVWRQLSQGVAHVFVSRFANGRWSAPIQADAGQTLPATFPAIAAGDGGELLVVWVAPYDSVSTNGGTPTTHDQLMSSVLDRGAAGFGPPIEVDPKDVGDGTGVYPALAMAPNGNAYVVYRVVVDSLANETALPIAPLRPGDEVVDVRVARFNGLSWSSVGVTPNLPSLPNTGPQVNRLPGQVTMRPPTAANAPVIAVDRQGDAIVVWQEPDQNGYARIWARRLFGTRQGTPLEVSSETINGQAVDVDADAPAVSMNDFGGVEAAFRLQGGPGNPLSTPQVFVNALASTQSPTASSFDGALPVGGASAVGQPSVSLDEFGKFQAGFTAGSVTDLVAGGASSADAPQSVGAASGDPALTTADPDGGGAQAWPGAGPTGLPTVQVRQTLPGGGWQTGSLSAPISGPVSSLSVGPSGAGDAAIAFQQGQGSTAQVAVASIQAPPHGFSDYTPNSWVRPAAARITWDLPANAIGPLTYAVLLDGRVAVSGVRRLHYRLATRGLGQAIYHVRVIATDDAGQQTVSAVSLLKVDGEPPLVRALTGPGKQVRVRVRDTGSGASPTETSVSFGDRTRAVHGRLNVSHTYARGGRYRITIRCVDNAGNRAVDHLLVRVP